MELSAEVRQAVNQLRGKLDAMSYAELKDLAEFGDISSHPEKTQVTLSRTLNDDDSLTIIIITWREHWFGIFHTSMAEGFRINASGERSPLHKEDYWY